MLRKNDRVEIQVDDRNLKGTIKGVVTETRYDVEFEDGGSRIFVEEELHKIWAQILWTTAPANYDYAFVTTLRTLPDSEDQYWREIILETARSEEDLKYIVKYQSDRYNSGMYPVYSDRNTLHKNTGISID